MFIDVKQTDPDWLIHRVAAITASNVWKVMAKPKRVKKAREGEPPEPMKEMAARSNYRKEKIREYLTGLSANRYVSSYMEDGLENEEMACGAYEVATGSELLHGGLYVHDSISRFMASPDRRIVGGGLVEAKYLTGATTEANHIDLIEGAPIPEEYVLQCQAQLSCSGEQFVDFVSYDPDIKVRELKLFIKRIQRDEPLIYAIEQEVQLFLEQMVGELGRLGVKCSPQACGTRENDTVEEAV